MNIDELIKQLVEQHPGSEFSGLGPSEVQELESKHGPITGEAKCVLSKMAYGNIGEEIEFLGVRAALDYLPDEYTEDNPDFLITAMDHNSEFLAIRPSTGWEFGDVSHLAGTFEPFSDGFIEYIQSMYLDV